MEISFYKMFNLFMLTKLTIDSCMVVFICFLQNADVVTTRRCILIEFILSQGIIMCINVINNFKPNFQNNAVELSFGMQKVNFISSNFVYVK